MLSQSKRLLLKEIVLPFLLLILFFAVESTHGLNEAALTFLAITLISISLAIRLNHGEIKLFFIGIAVGLIIEVGLALIGSTQYFEQARFFAVPLWLLIAWGFGFIIITRIGVYVRRISS